VWLQILWDPSKDEKLIKINLLFVNQVVIERGKPLSVNRDRVNYSVYQIIVNVLGLLIGYLEIPATVGHHKDEVFLLRGDDLKLLIMHDVELVHDAIKGPDYNLVPIFHEPHLLY
jgi:hypothetical protein